MRMSELIAPSQIPKLSQYGCTIAALNSPFNLLAPASRGQSTCLRLEKKEGNLAKNDNSGNYSFLLVSQPTFPVCSSMLKLALVTFPPHSIHATSFIVSVSLKELLECFRSCVLLINN
jgi:hypothetical protein